MTLFAVADFCLIPMGTPSPSVGIYIAECQRVLEKMKEEGIKYEMHGYGTNLEGPFDVVSRAIEACHEAVHAMGIPRIATDIRIGTRVDKPDKEQWADGLGENERKRESVRRTLANNTQQQ
ncbi:uncharacterized protein FA14DRAFT_180591 [Meira miltonrushii]|uniref:Thiamine-binding protein domain-containing protein n=1 Tax=Meira miltonrushii TaxID=1280837 RepID=A0A316VCK3_9BASI|nr:uncharacterized protein FA14DRAFT_180591 [Meira miltonrushii]PWN33953.1 hypothetical protein FA14DRAFT_180591 [Meira miltonrushii]